MCATNIDFAIKFEGFCFWIDAYVKKQEDEVDIVVCCFIVVCCWCRSVVAVLFVLL